MSMIATFTLVFRWRRIFKGKREK